ncbi:MAG: murein biosynthesis integral membrane protein MurJ [Anaerolineaceae bacterium]|nr:murein biosynthesis integral membrane protein MurJ [Anaerolineaceae bacterium]
MSRLTRTSLLLAFFFALDKLAAILRQVIIARQFGLSAELDSFNVANNLPDLLFALISGGALAIAFIPVLSEVLSQQGKDSAWKLFSRIANLAFLVTGLLAILIAALANGLVRWEIGVAPGFGPEQQQLVVTLMRMNLVATLIFSISGLIMAGLQANQHFLLPAMAPLLYNIGQIFGALILSPKEGYALGGMVLPAFGLGVYGLVYGVIIGAILHLAIQIPGLVRYQFHWIPELGLRLPDVQKVLNLLGPRLVTMLLIQLIFIVRDNLASRLHEGAVSALTYGWMIQQLPETLIGTAIGTALLPTLAEQFARNDREAFQQTISRAVNVLVGVTLPIAAILSFGLRPMMAFAFGFGVEGTDLLLWVTRGYLAGLMGHCLLELAARSFYAQQDAITPLAGVILNVLIYIIAGSLLFRPLGAAGISLTDAIAFTGQAVFLLFMLRWYPQIRTGLGGWISKLTGIPSPLPRWLARMAGRPDDSQGRMTAQVKPANTFLRAMAAAAIGAIITAGVLRLGGSGLTLLIVSAVGMGVGAIAAIPLVWSELKQFRRL